MKIKHLLTATLLSVAFSAFSQTLSIGPKLGANFTTFSGAGESSYKPGFTGGIFLVYSKREHLGFSADLLYSGEGAKHTTTLTNGTTTVKYDYNTRLNYLRLPLHVVYFFNEVGDKFRPKIGIGPSLGYLMSTKQEVKTTTTTTNSETSFDTKSTSMNNYRKFDIGASATLGFNYRVLPNTWLNVDARYYYGLRDAAKTQAYSNDKLHNHGASIALGLALGF